MVAIGAEAARRGLVRVLLAAALTAAAALPGAAQGADDPVAAAVLTLDQERLFAASAFGRRTIASVERDAQALQAENRRIETDLETEEMQLTERRATMAPAEFRAAADAFDEKVKGIRAAQSAKLRDLAQQRDAARQRFLQAAAPVLAAIMTERSAVVILDRSAIILGFDRVDITDLAIARVDAVLLGTPPQDLPQDPPQDPPPAPVPGDGGGGTGAERPATADPAAPATP